MQLLGTDFTQVVEATGEPEFPLGTVAQDQYGWKYRYFRANGAIGAKRPVEIDINDDGAVAGNGERCDGVTLVAFADNEYGWVQMTGKVTDMNVATSITAGALLTIMPNASNELQQISATSATTGAHSPIGHTLEAESGGVADVYLRI